MVTLLGRVEHLEDKMSVQYNSGEIIEITIKDGSGARIDRFVCNSNDDLQLIKLIRIISYKYGMLSEYDIVKRTATKEEKKFIDF